jgi:ketosteroid isomerase-like protein
MSQENVEAFKRGLEAGNRGDVETLLEELDPEVEWHSALHALLGGEQTVFRGHDGVREMLRDLNEAFGEIRIEMSEIRDLGDRLVAIGHTRTRGRESGAETETPLAFVTEIRNGKTISIQAYLDPRQALEAVGLSEQDAHADS